MKHKPRIILATTALMLTLLACATLSGSDDATTDAPDPIQVNTTVPAQPTEDNTLIINDDFTDQYWGTGTDADSSIEYANNALQVIVFTDNYFTWSTPDEVIYQNVHMEVTVINNGTDSTTAFGFMCNMASDVYDFYYFAITPGGQYTIAKATDGQDDLFLTNNDDWGNSNLIPVDAPSYRLSADCGNGNLSLYVNGNLIDSVYDSTYTSGLVGLFTWSDVEATTTNVSFDDFLMKKLQ